MSSLIYLILALVVFLSASHLAYSDSTQAEHILKPDDRVSLTVYQESDLSASVTVLKGGSAAFPLIGSVQVGGLSVAEASDKIRDLFAADYLINPQVTLTVDQYATQFISVIGQVKTPGEVPLPHTGTLDIGSAIATAGGITENADPKNIQFLRAGGQSHRLTFTAIQGKSGRYPLQAGDKIIVHENPHVRSTVSVLGQVSQPGILPIPRSGKLDLAAALASVGGLTPTADQNNIRLVRANGSNQVFSFQAVQGRAGRTRLASGDRVVVGESQFANASLIVQGQVSKPGVVKFPLDGRLDLITGVAMAGGLTEYANPKKVTIKRNGQVFTVNYRNLLRQNGERFALRPNDIVTVAERLF